jgi:Zn-dependent peptidase ImmA (M78 family)
MNHLVIEKKSEEFRASHGLGSSDVINLSALLFKLNILTVFRPLGEDGFSGMAIKVYNGGDTKRFILVNTSKTLGHENFTICHELYHLFIQENFTSMVCKAGMFNKKDGEEYNADVFASFFLMPESVIMQMIPDAELSKNKITLKSILRIEQTLLCSRAAIINRLKYLEIADDNYLAPFTSNIRRSAVEFGYTTDLYTPTNQNAVLGDYGTIARELFDSGIIAESHYISLLLDLGMNENEIHSLYNEGE